LRLLGRSERTLALHQNSLAQFAKAWGKRDLREVAEEDLEAYAKETLARVTPESAYNYLHSLRTFFRFLEGSGLLLLDPARRLPMPRVADRLIGSILSPAEMKRLVESPDPNTALGLRDRALLEFLYSTGLRISENLCLKVADLGEDSVTVRGGKGAQDRVVPVGASAIRWIKRYLTRSRPLLGSRRPPAEELWLSFRGNPFDSQIFQIQLRKLGERAGIRGLSCHVIRRSMATHLLRAGASPQEVSGILGHSDLGSLSRYVKVALREVKETHEKTHPRETP
jgi:integrase/recombinase XerD